MSAELDKFKRRVIRSVARVMRQGGQDKQADDKMWENLQKEVGCDCKLLWERMRTLTLKKMKRLLPAEDRLRAIADVAQMQLTDWLLFDLVLVHEDIDVITEDPNSKSMKDLLNLVQMFEIEGKSGDALTTAWTAATFHYNSFGRQCSPMLLQRRWYQLKKVSRSKFYTFWYEYRGNQKLLEAAKKKMPNSLHSLVAQSYPYVITRPFSEWQELIAEKFVILPEEFEAKMRTKNAPKSDKNEPDIVLMEPQIETIDLGLDSDDEENSKDSKTEEKSNPEVKVVTIKKEKEDTVENDDILYLDSMEVNEDIEILRAAEKAESNKKFEKYQDITCKEVIDDVDPKEEGIDETNLINSVIELDDDDSSDGATVKDNTIADYNVVKTEKVENNDKTNVSVENENVETIEYAKDNAGPNDDYVEINDTVEDLDANVAIAQVKEEVVLPQITNVFGNVNVGAEVLAAYPVKSLTQETPINAIDINNIDEVIRRKAIEFTSDKPNIDEVIRRKAIEFTSDKSVEVRSEADKFRTDKVKEETVQDILNEVRFNETHEISDGSISPKEKREDKTEESSGLNPFEDLTTGLTFEDDGIELVDDGIEYDDEDDDSQNKSGQSSDQNVSSGDAPKFDLKLLMQPVVYTMKLEDMTIFKKNNINSLRDKPSIDAALLESKPSIPKPKTNTEFDDETNESSQIEDNTQSSSESEEEEIPEENKVKFTSYLLRKPRRRSYNPIQLCKNPDFNTRLKRLTFGFLSSTRNRSLLRSLKPMTIDLSKAFEAKLINGTMYLKSGGSPMKLKQEQPEEDVSKQAISNAIMPLAMPAQSLIDNTNVNIRDIMQPAPVGPSQKPKTQDVVLNERQKTINLPDINHIRRINQQLLTAEVTPMRVGTNTENFIPPVQLVAQQSTERPNVKESQIDVKPEILRTELKELDVPQKPPGIQEIAYKDIVEKNKVIDNHPTTVSKESASTTESNTNIAGSSSSATDNITYPLNKLKKYSLPDKPAKISPYRVVPQVQKLPWNKAATTSGPNFFQDTLLTIDTLQKMLNLCNDNTELNKMKPKQVRKILEKRKQDLEKRLVQYEETLKNPNDTTTNKDTNEDEAAKKSDDQETEKKLDDIVKVAKPPTKKPKINIANSYGDYCCWARIKLCYLKDRSRTTNRRHQCPRICKCCCREELAALIKSGKRKQRPTEIVISDDEDSKKINTTIDNVIKQNKVVDIEEREQNDSIAWVRSCKNFAGNEVSIQCDIGSQNLLNSNTSTHLIKDNEIGSALRSILPMSAQAGSSNKPIVRVVRKSTRYAPATLEMNTDPSQVPPAPSRKYVTKNISRQMIERIMTNEPFPIAPKPQGHIIIDGTKKLTVHNKYSSLSSSSSTSHFTVSSGKSKEKIVFLNNERRAMKGVKSPIYLGKNKILLTDVKFPSDDNSAPEGPANESLQPRITSSSLVLPPGVQLVLLPNGLVTYTLAGDVILTDEQKETLPAIIGAVQDQLNANASGSIGIKDLIGAGNATQVANDVNTQAGSFETNVNDTANDPPVPIENISSNIVSEGSKEVLIAPENTEVAKNDSRGVNDNDETVSISSESKELTSEDMNTGNEVSHCDNNDSSIENSPHDNVIDKIDASATDVTKENPQDTHELEHISANQNQGTSSNKEIPQDTIVLDDELKNANLDQNDSAAAANSNRKSLLSDLMEMSGIWDDIHTDVPAPNETTSQTSAPPTTVLPIAHPAATAIPAEVLYTGDTQLVGHPLTGSVSMPPPLPNITEVSSTEPSVPQLTPISTFAQLKYACENNGKFFKLDLENGTLSCGIKVCIKKQLPKSVIDLTEDDDDGDEHAQITQEPTDSPTKEPMTYGLSNNFTRSLLRSTLTTHKDSVKPLKLFRSVRILKKNKEHTVLLPATEAPTSSISTILRRRKQNMTAIRDEESRSSTPVEIDDDSLDSESLDDYIYKDSDFLDSFSESGESSDDEPLASKAKRMRMQENNADSVLEDVQVVVPNAEGTENEQVEPSENLKQTKKEVIKELPQGSQDEAEEEMPLQGQREVDELPHQDPAVCEVSHTVEGQNDDTEEQEEESVEMAFMPDDMDEDDNDCILGV